MKKIDKNEYPKLEFLFKKKWLKTWWKKNINTFVYATENPEVKEEIINFREKWCNNETATTPKGLYKILYRMFLKEAEERWGDRPLEWQGISLVKNGEIYRGIKGKWNFEIKNPFDIFDKEITVPKAKIKLLEMLSNIHKEENRWIFEPRFFTKEEIPIYPTSHIFIYTLHNLNFLKQIRYGILQRLNLDYFVFWPLFFFYILTNDIDYTLKNAIPSIYPIKLFLIDEMGNKYLTFRLYGDCNFNEIMNFMEDKRTELRQLNKLMGNQAIKAGDLKNFYLYKDERKPIDIAVENLEETNENDPYLKGLMREAKKNKDSVYKNTLEIKERTKNKRVLIKTVRSQIKKQVNEIAKIKNSYKEIDDLIDKINNPKT